MSNAIVSSKSVSPIIINAKFLFRWFSSIENDQPWWKFYKI
jgi:hypothetical protein